MSARQTLPSLRARAVPRPVPYVPGPAGIPTEPERIEVLRSPDLSFTDLADPKEEPAARSPHDLPARAQRKLKKTTTLERLVTKVLRDVMRATPSESECDLKDALKTRCAALGLPRHPALILRAFELVGSNRLLVVPRIQSSPVIDDKPCDVPGAPDAASILGRYGISVRSGRLTPASSRGDVGLVRVK
jgi:hypothetical protein